MKERKNYAEHVAKGTIFVFTMFIASALFGYLLRTYMARNLSIAEYGLFYSVFAFVSFMGFIRELGFNVTIAKFIPEFLVRKSPDKIKSMMVIAVLAQLVSSLVIIFLIWLFSPYLSEHFFKTPESMGILFLLLIFFLIQIFFYSFRSSLQGFGRVLFFSAGDMIFSITTAAVIFIMFRTAAPSGINASYGYIAGSALSSAIMMLILIRIFPYIIGGAFSLKKDFVFGIFNFSAPIFLYSISSVVLIYVDTITLTYFRNLTEVGLYEAAIPIAHFLAYFAVSIESVFLPLISELWSRKRYETVSRSVGLALKASMIFMIPIVMVLISYPDVVINIIFGPNYVSAAEPLRFLAIGFLFYDIGMVPAIILNGMGSPRINTRILLAVCTFNIITNIALVPGYGMQGVAFSVMLSYILFFALEAYYLRKEFSKAMVPVSIPWLCMLKIVMGGIVTLIIIHTLKILLSFDVWVETAMVMIPSFAFYGLWILFMGCIDKEDMKIINKSGLPIPDFMMKRIEKIIGR